MIDFLKNTYLRLKIPKIMIIYSVTVSVEENIEKEWVQWMREIHIPEVMATGLFLHCRFAKLVSHKEEGHVNYSAQYGCASSEDLQNYKLNFAKKLQQKSLEQFADKMHAFRSELEVIEDF